VRQARARDAAGGAEDEAW